ncbi:MAG: diaminopimelate decarboxylase [Muribaculaceae bacterium]|nr:diaminopimelate decarboxylase [Muribaculaceae bacterium]
MAPTVFPVRMFESQPTPFYYYDMQLLGRTLEAIREAAPEAAYKVHYAVKACADMPILKAIAQAGLGADTVSGGEIKAAIEAGFDPSKIVFAGVGKTDDEIRLALSSGISCLNVESVPELEVIAGIASEMGVKARVALRVNPDIDAHTHHYITTGLAENKFGIDMRMLDGVIDAIQAYDSVELIGLHFHIGSQITDNTPYAILCRRINALVSKLESRGVSLHTINVGGGLGIDYDDPDACPIPDFKAYFEVFRSNLELRPGQELHFELGRSVVAQCGSLITRVLYVKEGVSKRFVIVDAGLNDLIRPALYQAHHKIQNLTATGEETEVYDVVGPICESSDTFGTDEVLPVTHRGDILALRSAGAYGRIMASQYNCRPIAQGIYS